MVKRSASQTQSDLTNVRLSKRVAMLRIGFGVVWAVDAAFKFEPAFYRGILNTITAADAGEPSWLNPWFHAWFRIIGSNPQLFAVAIIIIESLIALSLLFGVARRLNYTLAIPFCLLIWSVSEGFGGPYVAGSTDIGAGLIYVFAFLLLYVLDGLTPPAWSLDTWLEKRIAWWHVVAHPKTSHGKLPE